jgi:hypothetical protein
MSDLPRRPLFAAALILAAFASTLPRNALSQTFGNLTLGAGQSRQISIGPTFRDMRVCNDLKSTGQVVVKIGSSWDRTLKPGHCAQDRGNMIYFRNLTLGTAKITYRSLSETSPRWNG